MKKQGDNSFPQRLAMAGCVLLLTTTTICAQEREERERDERRERQHADRKRLEHEREEFNLEQVVQRFLGRLPAGRQERVRELLREHFAHNQERLERIAEEEPEEAVRMMAGFVQEANELAELQQNDPEAFQRAMRERYLERDCEVMAETCRQTEGEEQQKLKAQLRTTLAQLFEIRQARLKQEVAELERETARMKERLAKREQHQQEIIDKRLRELLGEEDYLEW